MAEVIDTPLDVLALMEHVRFPGAGAIVTFVGIVRDTSRGRDVDHLEYEAYQEMAEAVLGELAAEVEECWPGMHAAIAHRVGSLQVGEAAVVIAVSAPHRAEAFDACEYAIDRLKEIAPIWKKEFYTGSGEAWIGKGP